MAKKRRIQTPISQHWNHFRTGLLPLIAFLACIWVTMSLWERRANQGTIVAEATASAVDVASGSNGLLKSLVESGSRDAEWQVWDEVGKGEVIAVLDDSLLRQEIEVVRGTTDRLVADLEATRLRAEADIGAITLRDNQNYVDRIFQKSRFLIQRRQVYVALVDDTMRKRTLEEQLRILQAAGRGAAKREKKQLETEIDQLDASIYNNTRLGQEITSQLKVVESHIKEQSGLVNLPALDEMQKNLDKAVKAQDSQIDLIRLRIDHMTIRSPVAGVISAIHKRPGEAIVEGEPVMTVVNDSAEYVVGYWRENHSQRPSETMVVSVRLRQPDSVEYQANIEEIGPQYGQVPLHQQKDPSRPEYGIPVKVRIPDELQGMVRPGELVHLIYRGERR